MLPTLAVNLLSDNPFPWRLEDFHYGAPLVPFLFISAIYGIRRITGWLAQPPTADEMPFGYRRPPKSVFIFRKGQR